MLCYIQKLKQNKQRQKKNNCKVETLAINQQQKRVNATYKCVFSLEKRKLNPQVENTLDAKCHSSYINYALNV